MGHTELSDYEIERFGDVAPIIRNAFIKTVNEAQDAAVRAHLEQGWPDRDAYSNALRVNLNRGLLKELKDVPGVAAAKPEGQHTRFDLPVIQQTGVVLYWWRVPGDGKVPVSEAKLRKTSRLQAHLMTLSPSSAEPQMTFEHAMMTEEELEQHFIEDEQFRDQMSRAKGRTVMLWVSASPDGLFDFGWGDAELVNEETGELAWTRGPYSIKNLETLVPTLKLVGHDDKPLDRFDADAEHEEGFDLSVRSPDEQVFLEEQDADEQNTGSEDS
ncbi:hypothetical protein [Rhodococcus ruber]|uniref:hypothetical protein n=1 Tax=Rhodococcus ruber TaxID=1830 RepID=UPI000E6B3C41|nr:hypothetical protein [Rhodococcus ruber]AXY49221.1 hypothetical protein YT1_p10020 [Rhodococcus ruber]